MNAYDTLGVQRSASEEDIKKAFRALAKKHHPDVGGNVDKFKEVSRAYAEIGTPDKRRAHDMRYGTIPSPASSAYRGTYTNARDPRRGSVPKWDSTDWSAKYDAAFEEMFRSYGAAQQSKDQTYANMYNGKWGASPGGFASTAFTGTTADPNPFRYSSGISYKDGKWYSNGRPL